jgi:hypothetical protein
MPIHHIIPRCLGGTDDPSNLIELTYDEHVEAHRILSEQYPTHAGLRYAYLKMRGLPEEAHREASKRGGAAARDSGATLRAASAGGKKHVSTGHIHAIRTYESTSAGAKATAAQRWKCICGLVSTPGAVGTHQRRSGCKSKERII